MIKRYLVGRSISFLVCGGVYFSLFGFGGSATCYVTVSEYFAKSIELCNADVGVTGR